VKVKEEEAAEELCLEEDSEVEFGPAEDALEELG